jgi:hypothetical protein
MQRKTVCVTTLDEYVMDAKFLIRQSHGVMLDEESKEKLEQLYIAKENLQMRTKIGQGMYGLCARINVKHLHCRGIW